MKPEMEKRKLFVVLTLALVIAYGFASPKKSVVLCLGDSITESEWGNYPAHLDKLFRRSKATSVAISQGRPGNTSGEYLRFFTKADLMNKYDPDAIVIMLGTNDVRVDYDNTSTAKYKENMSKIIEIIRAYEKIKGGKIDIYICTIPPIFTVDLHTFTRESARRVEEEIVPAIKELSNKYNLELIDLNAVFKRNKDLLPGIHPSPGGYYKMAKVIFNRLRRESRNYCIPCQ